MYWNYLLGWYHLSFLDLPIIFLLFLGPYRCVASAIHRIKKSTGSVWIECIAHTKWKSWVRDDQSRIFHCVTLWFLLLLFVCFGLVTWLKITLTIVFLFYIHILCINECECDSLLVIKRVLEKDSVSLFHNIHEFITICSHWSNYICCRGDIIIGILHICPTKMWLLICILWWNTFNSWYPFIYLSCHF